MSYSNIGKFERAWKSGLPETPCGRGSQLEQTEVQREWLPRMVAKYGISSIADIGAGDLNWIEWIEWPHEVEYRAFDLVPRHPDVKRFDITRQKPEPVDCLLCIWVLNHLPEAQARQGMVNLLSSGSKYLVMTYWPAMYPFLNVTPIESEIIRKRDDYRGKIDFEIRLIKC